MNLQKKNTARRFDDDLIVKHQGQYITRITDWSYQSRKKKKKYANASAAIEIK